MSEVTSLDYKEKLIEEGTYTKSLMSVSQLGDSSLVNILKKILEHPKYRKSRHTHLVWDIASRGSSLSARQRACLEIHCAIEAPKVQMEIA